MLEAQGAHKTVCSVLGLESAASKVDVHRWKTGLADKWDALQTPVKIVLVGKYVELMDAYLSVTKALQHACLAANLKLKLEIIESENLVEPSEESPHDQQAYEGRWIKIGCE